MDQTDFSLDDDVRITGKKWINQLKLARIDLAHLLLTIP